MAEGTASTCAFKAVLYSWSVFIKHRGRSNSPSTSSSLSPLLTAPTALTPGSSRGHRGRVSGTASSAPATASVAVHAPGLCVSVRGGHVRAESHGSVYEHDASPLPRRGRSKNNEEDSPDPHLFLLLLFLLSLWSCTVPPQPGGSDWILFWWCPQFHQAYAVHPSRFVG
jgi:hypothetical protein